MMAQDQGAPLLIGPEQVWIETIDPLQIMWVGPNQYDRIEVLSGSGIEILALATSAETVALVGAKALVVQTNGTHSCEDLSAPLAYYVVTLGERLATDGPVTACGALTVSFAPGEIVLQEDPMRRTSEGSGILAVWMPGQGFVAASE